MICPALVLLISYNYDVWGWNIGIIHYGEHTIPVRCPAGQIITGIVIVNDQFYLKGIGT